MLSSPISAKTIYVDANAPGLNTGTSWADAHRFLQDALADANSSPKPVEIRVAQGIYRPDKTSVDPNGTANKKAFFQLISGVTLRGSYAGFDQPDPNARNVGLYQSILSGDLSGNDLSDDACVSCDNSECVVDGSGTDRTAVLDDFVITGGYMPLVVDRGGGALPIGGGMRNRSGSPGIINCTFRDNNFAVYNVAGSSPAFENCRFINLIRSFGGAITNIQSHPEITRCVFENNSGANGGVVYTRDGNLVVTACTFSSNRTRAILSSGGQLRITASQFNNNADGAVSLSGGVAVIDGCIFERNVSNQTGGAVYASAQDLSVSRCVFLSNSARHSGGGLYFAGNHFTISECIFRSNSAGWMGGGLHIGGTQPGASINNCVFESNTASEGGAICSGNLTLTGCLLVGNRAIKMDAGFYIPWYGIGGAISGSGYFQLNNCTLADNVAAKGPSLTKSPRSPPWSLLKLALANSIIWDQNAFDLGENTDVLIEFSNIRGDWPGVGNIDVDPCFAKPGYWDPNGTPEDPNDEFWFEGDYHLKSQAGRWQPADVSNFGSRISNLSEGTWLKDEVTSPCIDAGDPASPIGLEGFPNGGRINMGAYGGTAETSKSYFGGPVCETTIAGDINGDCVVDFKDFALLVLHWLNDAGTE